MSDPVDKKHADETEKHWVDACGKAQCDPDPDGAFVAFVCDILQGFVAGECELDEALRKQVKRRCQALRLNPLHVWNAVVALARTLPRKNG